jgi:hypothetical protein
MVLNRPIDSEITQVLDLVLIGHLVLCSACDEALEIGKHQGLEGVARLYAIGCRRCCSGHTGDMYSSR